jgi:hypothetical protein
MKMSAEANVSYALQQPIEKSNGAAKTEDRMTHESPGRNTVTPERKTERGRKTQTLSNFANAQNLVENPDLAQTDLAAGTQTELPSLSDALWEAINGIEEKAPGAPIERELMILDRVAEELGNVVTRPKGVDGTKP